MSQPDIFSAAYFPYHLTAVVFLGFFFGSFLNVCIYRIPLGQSIVFPGSHCFSCGTHIRWYYNIPLLSYIVLLGRCRYCGSSFSARYFFVELLTGFLFGLTFYQFRYTLATPVYIVFVCLLIVATFTDLDHWIIPDGVSIGGALFGILASVIAIFFPKGFIVAGAWPFKSGAFYSAPANALAGALTGAGLLYLVGVAGTVIFRKEAMGFGDVKLFLLIGAFLGLVQSLLVLMVASMLGTLIGGSMMLAAKISAKTPNAGIKAENADPQAVENNIQEDEEPEDPEERVIQKIVSGAEKRDETSENTPPSQLHHIPFGPYIAMGAIIVLLWGDNIIDFIFSASFYY